MDIGHHQYIPLSKLTPSPLNHRKHFDKAKMEELADSIRAQGVIQPILARPLNGSDAFEVVAGERRYRAAKMAKLIDIPAVVRDLTDAEALELQVIENGQRVDVHPLEEAEGFEALMNCTNARGEKYTVDEIASKVGKSKGYVYARMKLLALGPDQRKAFHDGTLDLSRAVLLARIPVQELQDQAMKEILGGDDEWAPGPMTYREAAEHVQDRYMLRLAVAPFKTGDAELLPAAGACTTCPKRTGNQPELFGDVKSADVCTDPKCFSSKRDAHLEQMRVTAIAKGKDVVAPNAKGYVKLDDRVKGDWSGRTYRDLLGKDAPAPTLMPDARDDKAKLVEVVKKSEIKETVDKKLAKQRASNSGGGSNRDWEQERKDAEAYRRTLFTHVCAKLPLKPGLTELTFLVEDALQGDAEFEMVASLFLPPATGKKSQGGAQARLEQALPKLDAAALTRLLVALHLSNDIEYDDRRLLAAAKIYGIDVAGVKAASKAELKAAAEKTAVEEKPAKKKAKKS